MPGIMDALKQRAQRQFVLIKSLLEYNHIAMPTIFMGNYSMTIAHVNMPSSFTKHLFLQLRSVMFDPVTHARVSH